jgi:hypothetical protein
MVCGGKNAPQAAMAAAGDAAVVVVQAYEMAAVVDGEVCWDAKSVQTWRSAMTCAHRVASQTSLDEAAVHAPAR